MQRSQQAERHLVVGDEHGRDVGVGGQLLAELVAGPRAPVADQHRRRRGAGGVERRAPAVDAVLRLEPVRRAGDVPDGAVAELEQVRGGEPGAVDLVDRDARHGVVRARPRRPRRARPRGRCSSACVADSCGAITRMPSTPCSRRRSTALTTDERRQRAQAHDAHEVARVVGGALDPEQRRRRPVQRRVEAHDAERARAAGDQRARDRVRPVLELAHRVLDALARGRAHVRAVVDHARDGLQRHAGELRHVGHHDRTRPRALVRERAHGIGRHRRSISDRRSPRRSRMLALTAPRSSPLVGSLKA